MLWAFFACFYSSSAAHSSVSAGNPFNALSIEGGRVTELELVNGQLERVSQLTLLQFKDPS
jgi:hypothetical protein